MFLLRFSSLFASHKNFELSLCCFKHSSGLEKLIRKLFTYKNSSPGSLKHFTIRAVSHRLITLKTGLPLQSVRGKLMEIVRKKKAFNEIFPAFNSAVT